CRRRATQPNSGDGTCRSHLLHALLFYDLRARADSDHFMVARQRDGIAGSCARGGSNDHAITQEAGSRYRAVADHSAQYDRRDPGRIDTARGGRRGTLSRITRPCERQVRRSRGICDAPGLGGGRTFAGDGADGDAPPTRITWSRLRLGLSIARYELRYYAAHPKGSADYPS